MFFFKKGHHWFRGHMEDTCKSTLWDAGSHVYSRHVPTLNPGRQRQQERIGSDRYLMNGLLVALPLLLLLFSSLYTSHAPILVLKKIACAIRVSLLHSWVVNYSEEKGWGRVWGGGPQKTATGKGLSSTAGGETGPLWRRMAETLTPAGCIMGLSVWFSVSNQPVPAVWPKLPQCNAANTIWEPRAGGYSAVCDEQAEMTLQSDQ